MPLNVFIELLECAGCYVNGNLRRLREARALSRRELAKRSNVDESTIYRGEHGVTVLRPSTIQKLAGALQVSPTEITGGGRRKRLGTGDRGE